MRLPITIRWTKTVEAEAKAKEEDIAAEAKARDKANEARNKLVANLLHDNTQLKAILHRWDLDHGISGRGGSQESKTPRRAGAVI